MLHYRTEAIILKRRNVGEADRVVTCFSQKFGKLVLLARGVRKVTSRRAGALELLNWSKISVVRGRSFDLIEEAETKVSFLPIKSDLYKTGLAYQIAEVTCELTAERQPSRKLFNLLVAVLASLSVESDYLHQKLIVTIFQLKALEILGFYSLHKLPLTNGANVEKIKQWQLLPFSELRKLRLSEGEVKQVYQAARKLVEEVIERKLKTEPFIRELDRQLKVHL